MNWRINNYLSVWIVIWISWDINLFFILLPLEHGPWCKRICISVMLETFKKSPFFSTKEEFKICHWDFSHCLIYWILLLGLDCQFLSSGFYLLEITKANNSVAIFLKVHICLSNIWLETQDCSCLAHQGKTHLLFFLLNC